MRISDWSSYVCSSDLLEWASPAPRVTRRQSYIAETKPAVITLQLLHHKLRAQHKALDPFVPAVNLLLVIGQPDRFDDRAALERLVRALHFQVLGQRHAVAVGEQVEIGRAHV